MKFGKAFRDNLFFASNKSGGSRKRVYKDSFFCGEFNTASSSRIKDSSRYFSVPSLWLFVFIWVLGFGVWTFFISQLWSLQIVNGALNKEKSDTNRVRTRTIRAERGVIYDSLGNILVQNKPGFSVSLDLTQLDDQQDLEAAIDFIATTLDLQSSDFLWDKASSFQSVSYHEVPLITKLSRDSVLELKASLHMFSGVIVDVEPIRDYIFPYGMSHVLGYVGEVSVGDLDRDSNLMHGDSIGKVGVEVVYDSLLRGINGRRLFEISASGKVLGEITKQAPVAGSNLTLTLVAPLQTLAYSALERGVEKSGAVGGAIVAQDPNSGAVLALVSFPSFSLESFVQGISEDSYNQLITDSRTPLFNRAVSATYPPGSVFKLVTATGVLEEGIADINTTIDDRGGITVGGFTFSNWLAGGHGVTSIVKAIAVSCDTYFYIMGGGYYDQVGLGVDALAFWARRFGLGAATGIDLPSEVFGIVPDRVWKETVKNEPWFLGNTYHMSIGQGDLLATPLQVNVMTSVVANKGTLYKPHLLADSGESFHVTDKIASLENLETVREGMRQAVLPGGTAYPMQNFPIKVGGKTGTSEYGASDSDKTHAWFTVFAPYDDPEIVLTVFLEGGGEGSSDATPVAREILEGWLEMRDLWTPQN